MSQAGKPPVPSLSTLARSGDIVTVEIGPNRQQFRVYTALLTYYSEYFEKALAGSWKEADDRKLVLTDIETDVFEVFLDWLNSQTLPDTNNQWISPSDGLKEDSVQHFRLVRMLQIRAYVFADRFLAHEFRRAAFNSIANTFLEARESPFYDMIYYAFNNLPAESPMLDLLIHVHCTFWEDDDELIEGELKLRSELPLEFFFRVMKKYSQLIDGQTRKECLKKWIREHEERAEGRPLNLQGGWGGGWGGGFGGGWG